MPGQVNISIDARGAQRYFKNLEKEFDLTQSRSILRKASTKTIVKGLRSNMTVRSSRLRKSFGNVTGKSKKQAIIFAGARLGGGSRERRTTRSTPMGRIPVVRAAIPDKHFGHLANIIEHNTFRPRYPRDPRRDQRKPRIPGFTGGKRSPFNIFEHSGVFRARPFIDRTFRLQSRPFLREVGAEAKRKIEKVR